MSTQVPRIGIGVFVVRGTSRTNPEFIMGKRIGSLGTGTWALPGGHLEFGESFQECARRELMEETGLEVEEMRFLTATNSVWPKEKKHYVTIFMVADIRADATGHEDKPQLLEPEKCEGWEWVSWEVMKRWVEEENESMTEQQLSEEAERKMHRLFLPLINLVKEQPEIIPVLT